MPYVEVSEEITIIAGESPTGEDEEGPCALQVSSSWLSSRLECPHLRPISRGEYDELRREYGQIDEAENETGAEDEEVNLHDFTVEQLRNACRAYDLNVGGTKDEIIDRLTDELGAEDAVEAVQLAADEDEE